MVLSSAMRLPPGMMAERSNHNDNEGVVTARLVVKSIPIFSNAFSLASIPALAYTVM
jgi:hypothetical protein